MTVILTLTLPPIAIPTMTETTKHKSRKKTRREVDRMLTLRQEMLVRFFQVKDLEPVTAEAPVFDTLVEFIECLVDYIDAGHHCLYERIGQGRERRATVLLIAREVYPRIARSSQCAADFGERYRGRDWDDLPATLHQDLSRLGEELAARIELEDRLLTAVLDGSGGGG